MFAFANMFHFFAHEFARLGGRRQTFAFVFTRSFDWFFFWHSKIVSPLARYLDVTKTVSHICIYLIATARRQFCRPHIDQVCSKEKDCDSATGENRLGSCAQF
jgi:hypothetical protein